MPANFSPGGDSIGIVRNSVVLALVAIGAGAQTALPPAPDQPLPFSHKAHAEAKLECQTCHANPDPGESMGIARASACMSCHKTVLPESPAIRKLAASAKTNREIKWARVYQIPRFVKFSHRSHAEAGQACEDCHGPVATRVQLARESDLTQIGCVACHRVKNAGLACTFCHE